MELWISSRVKNLCITVYRLELFANGKMRIECFTCFRKKDYPAYILQDGELYKVQVGAFLQLDNAIRMEQKLREDGYCTLIVTK